MSEKNLLLQKKISNTLYSVYFFILIKDNVVLDIQGFA